MGRKNLIIKLVGLAAVAAISLGSMCPGGGGHGHAENKLDLDFGGLSYGMANGPVQSNGQMQARIGSTTFTGYTLPDFNFAADDPVYIWRSNVPLLRNARLSSAIAENRVFINHLASGYSGYLPNVKLVHQNGHLYPSHNFYLPLGVNSLRFEAPIQMGTLSDHLDADYFDFLFFLEQQGKHTLPNRIYGNIGCNDKLQNNVDVFATGFGTHWSGTGSIRFDYRDTTWSPYTINLNKDTSTTSLNWKGDSTRHIPTDGIRGIRFNF
jgi:hypothetical protein